MMNINSIIQGDALESLKRLPAKCVRTTVSSPPYYGLRDYGVDNQIGLEETPQQYIQRLVDVFMEVHRLTMDDGTLWLNIADSYASSPTGSKDQSSSRLQGGKTTQIEGGKRPDKTKFAGIKPKDLIGIPWMLAFALRDAGWYLRQDIIWSKPNPMPESVTDRCTKAHEYIFLFSKSRTYYYDHEAIKQPIADASIARLAQDIENQKGSNRVPGKTNGAMKAVGHKNMQRTDKVHSFHAERKGSGTDNSAALNGSGVKGHSGYFDAQGNLIGSGKANKRSVWEVTTKPFKDAHFATFPQELIIDCIKAGSKDGDIVLDPFFGSGTTGVVARKLERNFIGIELNPKYIKIAEKRLRGELGLFAY